MSPNKKAVNKWTCEDVALWLQSNGFHSYRKLFCVTHKIDGLALLCITEEDLKNPPLNLTVLGDVKRLTIGINRLRCQSGGSVEEALGLSRVQPLILEEFTERSMKNRNSKNRTTGQNCNGHSHLISKRTSLDGRVVEVEPNFEPEIHKTIISYIYVSLVFFLTAFVMVEVHDRVPDVEKYPPLPDIILDNLPYMPWAFKASELCGVILSLILLVVIFLHKHK